MTRKLLAVSTLCLFIIRGATLCFSFARVCGHGYIYDPPARNYVANSMGLTYGSQSGIPAKEYCPQCVNQQTPLGICGITEDLSTDYDAWLDSAGLPMPFAPQRTYRSGQIIQVRASIAVNHGGHAEVRGCPILDEGTEASQGCLDSYMLEFLEDETYGMPKDPQHPERGYFYGGTGSDGLDFSMKFRLPNNLNGSRVLLQWQYITANSCSPPGYGEYFRGFNSKNESLPDSYWSPSVSTCEVPYPLDSVTGPLVPERFWNCAEVSILGEISETFISPPLESLPSAASTSEPNVDGDVATTAPESGSVGQAAAGALFLLSVPNLFLLFWF